jgi:N-acetylneuraminate synthase/N,N'-diacetyllegionaminate synthase
MKPARTSGEVTIGGRAVGRGLPTFVIAEAGVNHNGDPGLARQLIEAARGAGADAVKFQTFAAERVASASAPKAAYQLETTDAEESQEAMLRRLELPPDSYPDLIRRCDEAGFVFLSTPFDEESADLLDELGVPAFKIGSGELTNSPLVEHVARKGKPLLLSTGMAFLEEVEEAVRVARSAGNEQLVVLHCVSSYPADPVDANLRAMGTLEEALGLPVGFSDHTQGIEAPLAAVALGACVVEKHFTLDSDMDGPDHKASLEPGALAALVRSIRTVEASLGDGVKRPVASEEENRNLVRRSLVAREDIAAGATLTAAMLTALRPGGGISPAERERVVGRTSRRAVREGEPIAWSDLE